MKKDIVLGLKTNYVEKSNYIAITSFANADGLTSTIHLAPIWYEIDFVGTSFELTLYNIETDDVYVGDESFYIQVVYHRKA